MTGSGRREGFTTGSAAAAAAKAATIRLLTGRVAAEIDIPLPRGGRLTVPVLRVAGPDASGRVRAVVVKDAGDDPDVTHGAEISALVAAARSGEPGAVAVDGGEGVGRATLPGLPVPVGAAAINPAPLAQIAAACREAMAEAARPEDSRASPAGPAAVAALNPGASPPGAVAAAPGPGQAMAPGPASGMSPDGAPGTSPDRRPALSVVIEVKDGAELARGTLNPRLGIVGGVSILGHTGIVRPFSHEAWAESVTESLAVARAMGLDVVILTTGRRTEALMRDLWPESPEQAFIQAADHFALATGRAGELGFSRVVWGVYFGKLVKMAQGLANTHARETPTDFGLLAEACRRAGAGPALAAEARRAVTARRVLELLSAQGLAERACGLLAEAALAHARGFAGPGPVLELRVFDFDGRVLV